MINEKKKIAFISESCYVHIDYDIIPKLAENFEVGWFVYFSKGSDISSYLVRKESICTSCKDYILLKNRMRSCLTSMVLLKFLSKIKKWKPDMVFLNADGFPFLPIWTKFFFGNKKILTAIHDPVAHSGSSKTEQFCKKMLPKIYDNLSVFSEFSFSELKKMFSKDKNIFLMHHPLTDYGEGKKNPCETFVILFFGTIRENKGINILIEAAKMAYLENNKILVKICGSGNCDAISEIKNNPAFWIENRHIADYEIPDLFSNADCLALPYKDATQSGPMMIALNYGLPIIASDIEAFHEFDKRFSGVTCIKNDVETWKNTLLERANDKTKKSFNEFESQILAYKKQVFDEWMRAFEIMTKRDGNQ